MNNNNHPTTGPSQERVQNALACLKEIQKLIITNNYSTADFPDIHRRHNVPYPLFYTAVRLGVFKKVMRGKFDINIRELDPIHARECLLELNKHISNRHAEKRKQKQEPQRPEQPAPVMQQQKTVKAQPSPQSNGQERHGSKEADMFKSMFIDSLVERFRRSLQSRTAQQLKEINDSMMESGII